RSKRHHVDPQLPKAPRSLSQRALDKLRHSNALGRAFQAVMPQIDACFDEHYAVAFADAQSRILFLQAQGRLFGAVSSVNFAPGGDWSEATCGTNAIGTALAQKKPITIFDAEHFCESWQPYSC